MLICPLLSVMIILPSLSILRYILFLSFHKMIRMLKEIAEVLGLLALVFPFTYLFKVVLYLKSRVSYLEATIETYGTVIMEICSSIINIGED